MQDFACLPTSDPQSPHTAPPVMRLGASFVRVTPILLPCADVDRRTVAARERATLWPPASTTPSIRWSTVLREPGFSR